VTGLIFGLLAQHCCPFVISSAS